MRQIVTESGELILERTAYMSYLMQRTYPQVAIIALQDGKLEGAWEKAIADELFLNVYADQNPQAYDILEATGDIAYNRLTFLKAAYLITKSKRK